MQGGLINCPTVVLNSKTSYYCESRIRSSDFKTCMVNVNIGNNIKHKNYTYN